MSEEPLDIDELEVPTMEDEIEDSRSRDCVARCPDCHDYLVEKPNKWWYCASCECWYPAAHVKKRSKRK